MQYYKYIQSLYCAIMVFSSTVYSLSKQNPLQNRMNEWCIYIFLYIALYSVLLEGQTPRARAQNKHVDMTITTVSIFSPWTPPATECGL